MEDEAVKSNLMMAIAFVQPFQLALMQSDSVKALQRLEVENAHIENLSGPTCTGKFECLLTLLRQLLDKDISDDKYDNPSQDKKDKILVFVERVSVACCMARLLSSRLGLLALHVAGVQGMDGQTRQSNLASFKGNGIDSQLLVATSSLEEGLDVPSCRYVIRYDSFNSAKSHVQGAGRARHPQAQVYYFENDPSLEEGTREFLEAIARRSVGDRDRESEVQNDQHAQQAQQAHDTSNLSTESLPQGTPSTGIPGVGTGHQWGVESTMWDYQNNKSFRGMTCPCGARLKVTSRAYGQGRKKKERSFTVEGPSCCPMFTEELDARFQGVDPITGVLRWKQKWRGMVGTWTKWDEIGCSVLQTKNLVTWSSSLYRLIVRVRAVIHFLSPWPFGILHLNERGVSCWVDAVAVLVKLASAEEERHKHETNQTKRGSPRKIDVQSQISMFNEPILGKQEKRREHVGFLQSRHLWSHGAIEPEVRGNCHLWSLIRLTVVTGYNGYNGYNQNFQPKLSGLSRLFRKFSSKVTTRSRTHRKMG